MNELTNRVIEALVEVKGMTEHELAKKLHISFVRYKTYKGQHFEYCTTAFISMLCYHLDISVGFLKQVSRYEYFTIKGVMKNENNRHKRQKVRAS